MCIISASTCKATVLAVLSTPFSRIYLLTVTCMCYYNFSSKMYHVAIVTSELSRNPNHIDRTMNMLENPLANLPEKSKIISVGMIPDVVPVVATNDRHTHIENSYVKINLPIEETERKIPNSIPTTKHSYFGPKLNAPVVDFRYYNKKPVYQGTVSIC